MEEKTTKKKKKENKTEEKFESVLLELRRVTHVRAGGKKLRFRAVVICGDKQGRVGFGKDSATDAAFAIEKATKKAMKNLIEIPIVEGTIPHEVFAKYQASKVLLKPQKKGKGLVAGGPVRVICRLAGIKDICAKILGKSKDKITNTIVTLKALQKLKKPKNANSSTSTN
jgi:small subunit ribosomal protein S5